MIALDQNVHSTARFFHSMSRRAGTLVPDLCRGLGVALAAIVVMSFLAALAFQPFMHA